MAIHSEKLYSKSLIPFDRAIHDSNNRMSRIGSGSIGGKAQGLVHLSTIISENLAIEEFSNDIEVGIPSFTVLCTDVFDAFMKNNDLYEIAHSKAADDRIAHAFQKAELPFDVLGDLRALIEKVHTPLAVRSSSLLEDATYEPFAGVYITKMLPNHRYDPGRRFNKLTESIKLVYASTYFEVAKNYRKVTSHCQDDEKMAVIIQNVVGNRHGLRFYPELSGVARSYNFYPFGRAGYEDGVIDLALGLGKTIVDGGITWTYSPAYPRVNPPYGSIDELLKMSQKKFWAINMGSPLAYDPIKETEYLVHENLTVAERDETLRYISSTYDVQSDRITMGVGRKGPRVLNFSPLLRLGQIPFNDLIKSIMSLCEREMGTPVEIEFAMTFNPHRLGLLQVRPMAISSEVIEVKPKEMKGKNVLIASDTVLGNGLMDMIRDVVYVIPENFRKEKTQQIAKEIGIINQSLLEKKHPYLLIVFGRLGSTDPWLGIPVNWGQISAVGVIVEASHEGFHVDMSQGSHFFHNLIGLEVCYLSVPPSSQYKLDWEWLDQQTEIQTKQFVRHVRLPSSLMVKIDGRSGHGVILKNE